MGNFDQSQITGNQETDTAKDVRGPDQEFRLPLVQLRQHGIGRIDVEQQGPDKLDETGTVAGIMRFPCDPAPIPAMCAGRRNNIRHITIDGFQ